ncbi:MAG: hypothetical protein ACRD1Q_14475 [Vicinamibacterales bacterium]
MVALTAAVFTERVTRTETRIARIAKPIPNRQELRLNHLPRLFAAWVVFSFEAPADYTFPIATQVRSEMGRLLWFESRLVTSPASGRGQCAVQVSFAVSSVGSYSISLLFETTIVWQQILMVALPDAVQ